LVEQNRINARAKRWETVIFNGWTKAGVVEATPGPSY